MKYKLLTLALAAALTQFSTQAASTESTAKVKDLQQIMAKAEGMSSKLIALTEAYIDEQEPRNPINAMYRGDNRFNHSWPNWLSKEFIAQGKAIDLRYKQALLHIDKTQLKGQDSYTYDIFSNMLEQNARLSQFPFELLPLNQFVFSPHNVFMQLASGKSAQPFNNAKDFDNFLLRSEAFVLWMEQAIENMKLGITQGVVQPKAVVLSMLPQLKAQIVDDPLNSTLMLPLQTSGDKLSAAEKQRLTKEYSDFIAKRLTPVFKKASEFVENEYLPAARESYGLSALPNGKAWYEMMIEVNTTMPLTAGQLHETGLSEVNRIHGEIEKVKQQVGFKGDLKQFFKFIKEDPQFYFSSAEEIIQAYEQVKNRMAQQVGKSFAVLPKADYIVQPYPESQAKSAPGASYIPAAADGSRPAVFFANTYNLRGQPKYGVETLSIHEAVPGHHLQLSLQNEVKALPRIRSQTFYTVFAEGWALYAESLGKELGFFSDPYQYYGMLSAELFRAMRLVVDTGLHAKGWSREQAIQYMLENSTMAESDVVAEVERYMVMPGQALSYKTGQLKIRELRTYAEQALGDKFDVKTFHNLVLLEGMLPMPLLERKIKEWVAEQTGNS
jgi:uncharacterized protein (DUF885 family)